jgi:glycosyltransferase involved in cell wall biosynthesis
VELSVVVPCLNGAKHIGTQLMALAKQDWSEPWEVVVSDNGSTISEDHRAASGYTTSTPAC